MHIDNTGCIRKRNKSTPSKLESEYQKIRHLDITKYIMNKDVLISKEE